MADFDWSPFAAGGATRSDSFTGMDSRFSSALSNMFASAPPAIRSELRVFSGYRSPQRQKELWSQAVAKYGSAEAARKWVAPPGRSQHNHGRAADLRYLSPEARSWVRENAPAHGLDFPLANEPWHVELAGARNTRQPLANNNSILSVIDPPTPTPVDRSILGPVQATAYAPEPVKSAAVTAVERLALPDIQKPQETPLASFNNERFGAAPKTARLQPAFDANRFAAPDVLANTPAALQRGLLDQQLDAGILPDVPVAASSWPGGPVTTAYTAPSVAAPPASIQTAMVQPPQELDVQGGLLGPADNQTGLLGGPPQATPRAQMDAFAAHTARQQMQRNLLGGIGGGLLGGLALGPVGAIAGGLLGRTYAKNSFFPDAPEAPQGGTRKEAGLSDYGRSVQRESKQFDKAVKSGKGGLW